MKLRTQVLQIGLSGVAMALALGLIGYVGLLRVTNTYDDSIAMGLALQSSQEVSLLHVAIRGDVVLALLGSIGRDKNQIETARIGLNEHVEKYNKTLGALRQLPLSLATKNVILELNEDVGKYLANAKQVLDAASAGNLAPSGLLDFQSQFTKLEAKIQLAVKALEDEVKIYEIHSRANVDGVKNILLIALMMATAIMLIASLYISEKMTAPMRNAVREAERLARGNLAVDFESAGNDEIQQLINALDTLKNGLIEIVGDVKRNAEKVSEAGLQMTIDNGNLTERTEAQKQSVKEISISMETYSNAIKSNADAAHRCSELAKSASVIAKQGGEVVEQVVNTMKEINGSAQKIADIINVIDGIAFQTNILALNAAVEAARAGEQGRGFAVVASEVRSLAGRSADAAKEIKLLITASVEQAYLGSELADKAGATMSDVVASVANVTTIVNEISLASSQQANGVQRIGDAIIEMDEATQQNTALVDHAAKTANGLKSLADAQVLAVSVFEMPQSDTFERLSPQLLPIR